ncbi:unnamed protein product, partial [Eruca vesicaria subsp. sativa]|nr:unnamed protein product [Eruca vesicaria subsp. sativa]
MADIKGKGSTTTESITGGEHSKQSPFISRQPVLNNEERGHHHTGSLSSNRSRYEEIGTQVSQRTRSPTPTDPNDVVPYDQHATNGASSVSRSHREMGNSNDQKTRRLASTIVSPTRSSQALDTNVTVRAKGATRALTFSPQSLQVDLNALENDQMIDALNEMDPAAQPESEMLECDDQGNDLLGEELMALQEEELRAASDTSRAKGQRHEAKPSREMTRLNVPLGIQTKKSEFLRRGSPRARVAMSPGPKD